MPGRPGRPGSSSLGTGHHLAVGLGVAVLLGVALGAVGRRAVHRGLGAGAGALAALVLVLAFRFLALPWLSSDCGIVEFAEIEVEILDQPAGGAGIGVLVEDGAVQLGDVLADLAFEPGAPQIDDLARRGRRRLVGQRLAGQQAHRFGHRALGALGDALEALAAILLVEHRGQIGATPTMRREPNASTRACSSASNTARASGLPGSRFLCTASS